MYDIGPKFKQDDNQSKSLAVKPPVSDHPKCEYLMVAQGRWSLARIETFKHIYFLQENSLHAISYERHV